MSPSINLLILYTVGEKGAKPAGQRGVAYDNTPESPSSGHFMAYFVTAVVFVVVGYLVYHNKQKVRDF